MIEVFKTNVECPLLAKKLVDEVHYSFKAYSANFDLADCDRIFRVKSNSGRVESDQLIEFLRTRGVSAEVLEGDNIFRIPATFKHVCL